MKSKSRKEISQTAEQLDMSNKLTNEATAKHLLGIADTTAATFVHFRTGFRTRAVLALRDTIDHKHANKSALVTVKLYRGKGTTVGSKEYQDYHETQFAEVTALRHPHIQQSLAGGVATHVGPYSIMQYVPGEELRPLLEQQQFTASEAKSFISQILSEIWIPLWSAGLRFKDCHPGNFVLTPEKKVVMIDTEQMRKDVNELLNHPSTWTQRDKHEASGLKRLAGLLTLIVMSAHADSREGTVKRHIKEAMAKTGLLDKLKVLGRDTIAAESPAESPADRAKQAVGKTIELIKMQGYLK